MLIPFGPQYHVGHAVIDSQHKELFAILNRLHDAMKERRVSDTLAAAFDDLEKYIRLHFKTEETLMKKFAYPGAAAHKAMHDEFVNRLFELYSDYERGHFTVPMKMAGFLREWLNEHIPGVDRKLGEFLADRN